MSQTAAAAIFDVDGTLSATRSTDSLIWLRAQQQSAWRHRLWLSSAVWRGPLALAVDAVNRDRADRMVNAHYAGLSRARLEQDACRCCEEVLLPRCFPDALKELEGHRAAGRRLVLLSAGVDVVLAPLAKALGAELISQRLLSEGDRMTGRHSPFELLDGEGACLSAAARKSAALRRWAARGGIDLAASFAYGDSVNDVEMLAAVGHPVAVNPDLRLARIARGRGWQTRRWRLASR